MGKQNRQLESGFKLIYVNCERRLLASLCLSACRSTNEAPTGRIFVKFDISYLMIICWETPNFVKRGQQNGALYKKA